MFRVKLGVLIALFAGPFILFMNFQETAEKKTIDRDGIETVAIPTSKIERRGRRGGKTFELEVQYMVEKDEVRTAQVDVSRELYERIDAEPMIKIKYLKETPSKLIVVGEPLEKPEMYYVGAAVLLFGIGGTWWYFIRKKPAVVAPEAARTEAVS